MTILIVSNVHFKENSNKINPKKYFGKFRFLFLEIASEQYNLKGAFRQNYRVNT
jgi:hypothetical protein